MDATCDISHMTVANVLFIFRSISFSVVLFVSFLVCQPDNTLYAIRLDFIFKSIDVHVFADMFYIFMYNYLYFFRF